MVSCAEHVAERRAGTREQWQIALAEQYSVIFEGVRSFRTLIRMWLVVSGYDVRIEVKTRQSIQDLEFILGIVVSVIALSPSGSVIICM